MAEFRDPVREHAFRAHEVRAAHRGTYLGIAIVLLADVVSASLEWRMFADSFPVHMAHLLVARAAVAAGALGILALLRWRPWPRPIAWGVFGGCALIGVMQAVVGYEYAISVQRVDTAFWFGIFVFLALTVPPVPLRFGLAYAAVLCAPALVLHTLVLDSPFESLSRLITVLVLSTGMGAALANRLGRSRRQEFALLASERQTNMLLQSEIEQRTEAAARLQEDKSELEARLQRAQQLEALGRLAAGVAHDLNNLLTPIMGYADLAQMELAERDPQVAGMMQEVNAAAGRARELVEQLLAFGRRQVLVTAPVDLNQLVISQDGLLRKLVGEAVRLRIEPAPGPAVADVDSTQLGRVLMNLAVNAADAMRGEGTLTIGIDARHVTGDEGLRPGQYVVLTVRDTGAGMDENTRQHIFEPFFTTKRSGHSGLGLATSYGIVQQHGGSIRVQSTPGEGTAFEIYLRGSSQPAAVPTPDPLASAGSGRITEHAETVLLAEDDDEVRRLVEMMLRRIGFRVLSAAGGSEAVVVARGHRGPVHVLLTDVTMPGISGPELWASLREQHPETRVLFMSGFTDQVIGRDTDAARRTAFLQKPFTERELARKLRKLIGQPTL